MRKVLAVCALVLCGCATQDEADVARANARQALSETSTLRDRVSALEDKVEALEKRLGE